MSHVNSMTPKENHTKGYSMSHVDAMNPLTDEAILQQRVHYHM